jgi:hypothetical protein
MTVLYMMALQELTKVPLRSRKCCDYYEKVSLSSTKECGRSFSLPILSFSKAPFRTGISSLHLARSMSFTRAGPESRRRPEVVRPISRRRAGNRLDARIGARRSVGTSSRACSPIALTFSANIGGRRSSIQNSLKVNKTLAVAVLAAQRRAEEEFHVWRDIIHSYVKNDEKLRRKLFDYLLNDRDVDEAVFWVKKLDVPKDMMPIALTFSANIGGRRSSIQNSLKVNKTLAAAANHDKQHKGVVAFSGCSSRETCIFVARTTT